MKLEKAIEILQMDIDNPGCIAIENVNEAEQIGIEAMKRIHAERYLYPPTMDKLLPGETKD